jgi:hypothetical protein
MVAPGADGGIGAGADPASAFPHVTGAPARALSLGQERKETRMGFGVSLILIAAGAILAWAVNVSTNGSVNLHTIGYILLVVGIVGGLLSMIFWSSWAGPGYFSRRRTYIDEGPGPGGPAPY